MFYPQFLQTVGQIPDDVSIPEWLFQNRSSSGNEIAFIDSVTDEKRTWKETEATTRLLARGLVKLLDVTVGATNVFGLFSPNVS